MTNRRRPADPVPYPAGRTELCLDFANTLCWRGSPAPEESLAGLPDLLHWLTHTAGLPALATHEAATWPTDHPNRASRLFAEAIALREVTFRLFSAVAAGAPIPAGDLTALNGALAESPPRCHLMPCADGYAWAGEPHAATVSNLLAPVLWSAADLLTRTGEHRVCRCANEKCLWLFIDRSKAGTRRWCDMAACGNRAKSQRHYARIKGS
jgi:predicted RNA-binding Zn ribbon-like protein